MESSFVEAWAQVSEHLRRHGSFGSRLHRGPEGVWYSYAQWPSAAARDHAFSLASDNPEAIHTMQAAIAESLPDLVLESVADLLVLPREGEA